MSPVLFNIYMDELSLRLQKSNVGCNCNGLFINHLVYADDMVLIAPSAGALQSMLNICCDYSVTHSITYNEKKTVTMYIKSAKIKPHHIPCITLNNKQLSYVDSYKYLGCIISTQIALLWWANGGNGRQVAVGLSLSAHQWPTSVIGRLAASENVWFRVKMSNTMWKFTINWCANSRHGVSP